MFSYFSKYFDYDWIVLTAVGFLLALGLVAIYSLSIEGEVVAGGNFQKQLIFLIIGVFVFLIVSRFDYRIFFNYTNFLYITSIILLVAVLFFGKNVRGTSSWFSFGFFNMQPVELVKIFVIIFLAKYFSRFHVQALTFKDVAKSFLYIFPIIFLAIRQPDMGSAMVILVIWLGMLFLAGLKIKNFAIIIIIAFFGFFLSWNFVLKDYQKQRIESFINPQADPLGKGYNVIQSIVAVGSGGLNGKGLGHGSQSRLNFLPEKHTDFIFATIAEESGLVGVSLIFGLFGLLFFRLQKTAQLARDNFGRLIVGGVMSLLFFQLLVNVGMNIGVIPVAGLALPFLSYGGSFLIVMLGALGLVQNIWRKRRTQQIAVLDQGDFIG